MISIRAVLLLLLGFSCIVNAGVVFSDNFEYPPGATLASEGWVLDCGAGLSIYPPYWETQIGDDFSVSGSHCMRMITENGEWLNMTAEHSFTPLAAGKIGVWVRSSHNADSVTPVRFYIEDASGLSLFSVLFASQWGVVFYHSDLNGDQAQEWIIPAPPIDPNVSDETYEANRWYHVQVAWDNEAEKTFSFWLDGQLIGTYTGQYLDSGAGLAAKVSFLHASYASLVEGDPTVAWYDDVVVTDGNCTTLKGADLNRDCYVDFRDFAEFAQNWLVISN